jgi:acyl dehydratase
MAMNFDAIGADNGHGEASWTDREVSLYALGVGAGQDDPLAELQFTTENSIGVQQQALPGFGVVMAMTYAKRPSFGDFHPSQVLHAEQSFTLHHPLPVQGRARVAMVVKGIYDKGKAALVDAETTLTDAESGERLMTTRGGLFVRGEGGFGGDPAPVVEWPAPTGKPDVVCTSQVRADQALLYRLSGDRNPLHSDPTFAAKGGFDRPILHGMCTYGITCRLLINALCGGDADRTRSLSGRFTKPVLPGSTLTVRAWVDGGRAQFQTLDGDGDVVLDRGVFEFAEEPR